MSLTATQIKDRIHLRYIMFVVMCCLLLCACGSKQEVPYNADEWTTNIENCWPCILYDAAFSALDKGIIALTYDMTHHAIIILGFGLLFWLLFKVGTFVVSVKEPNVKRFVQSVMIVLFKAILVAALLLNPGDYIAFIAHLIVQPVLLTFAEIIRQVLTSDTDVAQRLLTPSDITGTVSSTGASIQIFGDTKIYILDIIYRITVALRSGVALGMTILREPGLLGILFGLLIMLIFFNLLLRFPLLFIDSFIRLGVIIILSPFLFVAWVFPPTKSMIRKGWDILFGAMVTILFGSIFISLMVYLILVYTERSYPAALSVARQTADPSMVSGIHNFKTNALAFFVLLLAMNALANHIPKMASRFGGDGSAGAMTQVVKGLQNLGKNALKLAVTAHDPQQFKENLQKIKSDIASIAKG